MKLNLDPHDSSISVPDWLAARAKNATRRRTLIGAVSGGVFVATLVSLVLTPQRRHRIPAADLIPALRIDTVSVVAGAARDRMRFLAADSIITARRALAARAKTIASADSAASAASAIKAGTDTLSSSLDELQRLLDRVNTAPLSSSYDALAASRALSGNRHVAILLDSLTQIEHVRDTLGTAGATDPVYIALTSRITDLGRSIQGIAEERRDALRDAVQSTDSATRPAPGAPARSVPVDAAALDTVPWIAERDSAQSAIAAVRETLALDRDSLAANTRAIEAQRREAAEYVSPLDMLGAAVVAGLLLGFGVALGGELLHPRVADAREVERLTRLRVVATVTPAQSAPDRTRRVSDRDAPPSIESGSDAYQLTSLYLSRDETMPLLVALTGDDTAIVAVAAANLAAVSAAAANSVLLVDTDTSRASVAAALRVRAEPGFADIGREPLTWTDLRTHAQVGRDRQVDVIPSGVGKRPTTESVAAFIREHGPRFAKYYDAIIVVISGERVAEPATAPLIAWAPDTLLCVRTGHTPLDRLAEMIAAVRTAGGFPVGVLLWNAPAPALPTSRTVSGANRPLHTEEMKALTGVR